MLNQLNLDYVKVSSIGLAPLAGHVRMRDLSLDNTDVDDGAVEMLSGLRDLRSLNLYHTLVTETGV